MTLPAQSLGSNEDVPYRFTLTVSSGDHTPQSIYIDVFVSGDSVPETSIDTTDGTDDGGCLKVNSNKALLLSGTCSGTSDWTVSPSLADRSSRNAGFLSDVSIFPFLFSGLRFMISDAVNGVGMLVPGVQYSIKLGCTSAGSSDRGRAELDVCTNAIPKGGTCETCLSGGGKTCQTTGVAFEKFKTKCKKWGDKSDVPLQYKCVRPLLPAFGARAVMHLQHQVAALLPWPICASP